MTNIMRHKLLFFAFLAAFALPSYAAKPKVVAHRGYWKTEGSAQNSIRALVKADSVGCPSTEFDVWISADGGLYVNHNADINGVVIETADSAALAACRLGNGEPLPTLSAFLDTAATLKTQLVFELKPHKNPERENAAIEKIIRMVRDKGVEDRITYITFSRNAFDGFVAKGGRPVFYLNGVSPEVLKEIGGSGADYHINIFRKNPEWIGRLHSMGMPVNIWTVDSEADIQWCIDHGADYITTNEPELAMRLVEEAYQPRKLRVMTYNLRFGELADMDRLAREIKAAEPDFVAIQEVDVNTNRDLARHNNGLNYVSELAQRTGMFGHYARTLNFGRKGYYGIGILSRHPAVRVEKLELPALAAGEPRAMLEGVFEIDGKKKIVFASTHLDVKSDKTRALQAEYIVKRLAEAGLPAIIGGDFNAKPEEEAITVLRTAMDDLSGAAPTFPATGAKSKIDYLFGMPKGMVVLEKCTVPESSSAPASDHLPVVSEVEVRM